MPPRRSKKMLDLPFAMAQKPVAERMQLRNSNKERHPGTVDDWKDPDDVETLGEKIKKWAQKKVDSAKLQIQRDKAKVDVAILEDALRWKDVAQDLTANHPAGNKKCVPSARNKAGNNIDPQPGVVVPPLPSNQMSELLLNQLSQPEIAVTSTNEEIQEHTSTAQQKNSHGQDLTMCTGGEESEEESDEHIPHGESGDHIDAAKVGKPATKLGPKPRVKVSAHTAIANSRFTNEGVATPKLSWPTSGPESKAGTATAPKHVLKCKNQVIAEATEDETAILCSDDESIPPEVQIPPMKKQKVKAKTADQAKTSKPASKLAKNWEKKKSGDRPRNTGKKDTMNEENDSLVRAGGMVEDDKDIKPEFLNIVKTKGNSTDHKPAGVVDVIKIVKKEDPLIMTVTQVRGGKKKWRTNDLLDHTQDAFSKRIVPYLREKVGQSVTPWAPLSVEDVQEAVDLEFGRTEYCMGEKSAWMGLYMAYLITPTSPGGNIETLSPPFMWKVWKNDGAKRRGMFCHELIIRVMAEAHFMALGPMNNLSTIPYPKGALLLTGQAVERAISMWTTGVFVNTATPTFLRQNFDDITEEFTLDPAERAKYSKDVRKKTVKTKRVSVYQATKLIKQAVETSMSKKRRWMSAQSASPDAIEQEADIVFRSDPPDPDSGSDEDSGDSEGSVGTTDESAEEDNVAGSVTATTTTSTPSDVDGADGLSDSEYLGSVISV
ncbi:hypothetical protein EDD85DRAFT_789749 [Armillaria nabsnona]|nr:hypothetical protein EDD85DRAFT_789749 [Armillaria nabsnona]